jgi:hypothetical protein
MTEAVFSCCARNHLRIEACSQYQIQAIFAFGGSTSYSDTLGSAASASHR